MKHIVLELCGNIHINISDLSSMMNIHMHLTGEVATATNHILKHPKSKLINPQINCFIYLTTNVQ